MPLDLSGRMADYPPILSILRVLGSMARLRGANGSIPAAMSVTQVAVLFVLAVFMAALYLTPDLLIATALIAKEGSLMMKEIGVVLFQPVASTVSAIWCSCIAAGAVPCSI